jgi:hypothetical protein
MFPDSFPLLSDDVVSPVAVPPFPPSVFPPVPPLVSLVQPAMPTIPAAPDAAMNFRRDTVPSDVFRVIIRLWRSET